MRQLVKINKINKLIKHPNADRLQIASVGLWEVITSVGQFEELDDALYCEIDSLLPLDDPRFAFLIGRNQYNIDGKEYSRLKTMRLRKALSQGLLLPIKEFQKEVDEFLSPDNTRSLQEIIGIIKYDPPEYSPNGSNASRSGPGKPFPYFVPKTDQERIQNITEEYRDAAFSEELFEITYKLDGCFLYKTLIPTWDGSSVFIGDIVSKGLRPTLVGVDENGKIVPAEITHVFNNGTKKDWVDIRFNPIAGSGIIGKSGKLRCTPNHKIFKKDLTEISAMHLEANNEVLMYSDTCDKNAKHYIYSSLLGDGCIPTKYSKACSFTESHLHAQSEYNEYIASILGPLYCATRVQTSGYGSSMSHIFSKKTLDMNCFRDEWYGINGKKLPDDISWINDFTIAKWYTDDGSLSHSEFQNDRATFASNAFSLGDNIRLQKLLEEKYSVSVSIQNCKGYSLRINYDDNSISKFWKAIAPYIHDTFKYKLPKEYRDIQFIGYPQCGIEKTLIPVSVISVDHVTLSKENFNQGSVGFDIETNTHNYFCGGLLVHNSSITMYVKDNTLGVCSRNFEFNIPFDYTEWPNIENHFIKAALAEGVLFKLILAHSRLKHNFALQGELCIAKGTLISTPHGLIPIEEINTNDEVYSNGEITNVCKVFNNGIKNTFLYTLDTGASIRMTPEHRVFVFDKTGKLYKKAIKDVSPDEYLVTYLNSPSLNTDYINLMHDTILVDDYSSRKNTCDFPNILNEEFAYFLGIFYAEGCVINNNKKNLLKLSITLHKDEINISNRIKAFLDTVFIGSHGFNERVLESVNTRIIEIYSVDFVYYLSQNGFLKEKSDSLIFPELINISPQSVINAFISGFLDGDGDSCVKKLRISSNSASFLKMIQFHMLNVGCPTYLRCRANSNGKVLYGYNILSFIDNYNTLLSQSFKWQNGDKPIKSYYSYPFKYCDSLEVDEKVKIMSNINNGIYRLGNTSFNNLKKIIELSSNENLVNYFKLVSKHFLPTKIVSVSNEQLVQVYDLQVNNESHSYVANSLYVSNCGPGIQSNFEGLNKHEIYIYDIYDIDNKRYMTPHGRRALLEDLDIKQVPVFKYGALDKDIHKTLEMADGPSGLNGKFREGLVFKSLFRDFSFKAIGNSYLEKTDR